MPAGPWVPDAAPGVRAAGIRGAPWRGARSPAAAAACRLPASGLPTSRFPVQAEAAYQQAANQPQPQTPGCPPAAPQKRKHGPWTTFPYPILCVIVFLLAGFFLSAWHPAWVVFLTIPLYYWIANVIENDPVYRERTER